MTDNALSRRKMLGTLGAVGLGGLAGCNGRESSPDEQDTSTRTETIVFTDTPTESSDTDPTTRDPDEEPVADRVFDGGDSYAFASALEELSRNPGATLEIEPGTYRFAPATESATGKRYHFRPPNLEDVTIEGNGATIVFTNFAAGGFFFEGGSDVTIRNLTFDYDPVPFTQGTLVGTSDDRRTLRLELDEGYPGLDHEMFEEFDEPGGSIHTQDGEFVSGIRKQGMLDKFYSNISKLGGRRYELTLSDRSSVRGLQEGRKLLVKARRNDTVLYFYKVSQPVVENVTLNASNGAGAVFAVCDEPRARDCVIAPPADTTRLISLDADGVVFTNAVSNPVVENCQIEYTGDDPVVVQHILTTVEDVVNDRTVRLADWHPFVAQQGDVLRTLSQSGVRKGELPPIEEMEYRYGGRGGFGKPETVTFAEPVSETLSESDLVGNLATASHGFAVRNNTIRNVRGNLVRIAASHGVVENNVLEGSHRNGVEVECDTNDSTFVSKGGVTDVTVRNNEISRPGLNYLAGSSPSGIRVHHRTREGVPTEGKPNRNITIEGNEVKNGAHLGVEVEHAREIRIENNTMHNLNQLEYPDDGEYGVVVDHVDEGVVSGNAVSGSSENLAQFGVEKGSQNVSSSDNQLQIDGESLPAKLISWTPMRIAFDRTVTLDGSDRSLALRCFRVSLLDESGDVVMETNVGRNETAIGFGDGAYSVEQESGESWRWLGGESETTTVYFHESQLDRAVTLQLRAKPIERGISARFDVDGQLTDEITFDTTEPQLYEISLTE